MILLIFSPAENSPFLLMEATVCAGSATEGKQKTNEQKLMCRTPTLARSSDQLLLLSCDSDLKSDWFFQLSGSGSNSLNSRKLPGRFSLPKRPGNEARSHVACTPNIPYM